MSNKLIYRLIALFLFSLVIALASGIKSQSGGGFEFSDSCLVGARTECRAKVAYASSSEVVWEDSSGANFRTRTNGIGRPNQYDTYLLKLDPPSLGEEHYQIKGATLLPKLWLVCSTSIPDKKWWVGNLPQDTGYFIINEEVNGRRIELKHGASMGEPTYFASEGIGGRVWQISQTEAKAYGWIGPCSQERMEVGS